jgi:hypothetical protein
VGKQGAQMPWHLAARLWRIRFEKSPVRYNGCDMVEKAGRAAAVAINRAFPAKSFPEKAGSPTRLREKYGGESEAQRCYSLRPRGTRTSR